MIRDLVAATGFAAFVVSGITAALLRPARRAAPHPPQRVRATVLIGVMLSLLAGLSRRELWPFAHWALMYTVLPASVRSAALVCVTPSDSAFPVDHRAWSPLTEEELLSWLQGPFLRLDTAQQRAARGDLLRMAEVARRRVRSGGNPSAHPSVFGPLAAGSHLKHPDRWVVAHDAPATPCAGLRLVERNWNVDSLAAGRGAVAERIVWEFRP